MEISKTLLRRVETGIFAAFIVIMCASLSFAGTTIYVYQAANTGALTVKTITDNGIITNPVVQSGIPNSCFTPDLFWDSDAGKLRINGFDSNSTPAWTGTVGADGLVQNIMPSSPSVSCNGGATASVVSALFLDQPTIMSSSACSSWSYGSWTPASCAAGSIQTRTATGSPSGCIGFPDAATVQSCPPQTCTSFTYACNGTCSSTTSTCPAVVTSSSPSGCVGGTPVATISCTPGVACTGYTYSAWGTCTNGTQSRTVTGYTPASCSGTPSSSSVLTQACSTSTPGGPIILAQNDEEPVTLAAKQTQLFKLTTPTGGCSAALHKWLKITLVNVSLAAGDGQLLVKSSNHGASTAMPTLADYTSIFGQKGYSTGQDWTRDPNGGVFFWNWSIGGTNEILAILPTYAGRTFSQDDTYYMLLYNQGATQNSYRVLWQCY